MIYVKKGEGHNNFCCPIHKFANGSDDIVQFVITSNGTNKDYTFDITDYKIDWAYIYFDIDFSDVEVGEYEYQIKLNGHVLTKGLLKVEGESNESVAYVQNEVYKQYEEK